MNDFYESQLHNHLNQVLFFNNEEDREKQEQELEEKEERKSRKLYPFVEGGSQGDKK